MMIRCLAIFFVCSGLSCGPVGQPGDKVTPGSFSDAVRGVYQGRMVSHLADTTGYRVRVLAVNDSMVRIEPLDTEYSSAFLARLEGPSSAVLKIFYQEDQIGTFIAGVMKYRRALGSEYREYFSGSLVREEKEKNLKSTAQ